MRCAVWVCCRSQEGGEEARVVQFLSIDLMRFLISFKFLMHLQLIELEAGANGHFIFKKEG